LRVSGNGFGFLYRSIQELAWLAGLLSPAVDRYLICGRNATAANAFLEDFVDIPRSVSGNVCADCLIVYDDGFVEAIGSRVVASMLQNGVYGKLRVLGFDSRGCTSLLE